MAHRPIVRKSDLMMKLKDKSLMPLCSHRVGSLPVFSALVAAALLPLITGCGKGESAEADKRAGGDRPSAIVSVEPILLQQVSPRVVAVGSVTAKRTSIVASGADGIVDSYTVDEGEWVEKGTVLSQLRMKATMEALEQAKAIRDQRKAEYDESLSFRKEEIAQAKAEMEAVGILKNTAAQKLLRAETAYRQGALNKDLLADAHERAKQTEALFLAATAEYAKYKAGPRKEKRSQAKAAWEAQKRRVAFLEAEKEKRTTRVPFAGYVVKEHSFDGQWLAKGDPVATIAMLDEIDVVVNVDQSDIRHVRLGESASVDIQDMNLTVIEIASNGKVGKRRFEGIIENESAVQIVLVDEKGVRHTILKTDVVSRNTQPWTGTVMQIVPRSNWKIGSRGFPVKVRIKNRFHTITIPADTKGGQPRLRKLPLLKEGMMATVTFQGNSIMAFLVPKDAIVRTTQGMKLNIFRPSKENPNKGDTIQLRVNLGIGIGDRIQISPHPANPGEPTKLAAGMLVVTDGAERLRPVQANVVVAGKKP